MSDKIIKFPTAPTPPSLLVGPFEFYQVIVDGRAIPRLTGRKFDDGSVSLTLDRRFEADFPDEATASQAAWLIAQALAIGEGYAHLGAEFEEPPVCADRRANRASPPMTLLERLEENVGDEPSPAQEHAGIAQPLTPFEVDVLRVMNGEPVEGMVAGAAMWVACAYLKGRGLAEGHYSITRAGRAYLADLPDGSASDRVTEAPEPGTGRLVNQESPSSTAQEAGDG